MAVFKDAVMSFQWAVDGTYRSLPDESETICLKRYISFILRIHYTIVYKKILLRATK